jgi:hypothetical protein
MLSVVMQNAIVLSVIMLSVLKLNVIMLNAIMLSVIMLNAIMQSVIMRSVMALFLGLMVKATNTKICTETVKNDYLTTIIIALDSTHIKAIFMFLGS